MDELDKPPVSKTEGTKGTEGTQVIYINSKGTNKLPDKDSSGNLGNLLQPVKPSDNVPEKLPEPEINRPGFHTHDDWFTLNDNTYRPGLYWHSWAKPKKDEPPIPIDEWVCTPIHANAITADERDESFGLLIKFVNPNGQWREWAAPMHLLRGSAEELRGELLNMGVRIDPTNRNLLVKWMMSQYPKTRIIAALRTGWYGKTFVLPKQSIGAANIRYQSEHATHNDFVTMGTLNGWREEVSRLCKGNPLLILAVSAAFTGPLLKIAKLQETGGAGIHLMGDSSQGKTTALQAAGSVWGSPSFVRTWRATSNGLEATAAALNDTLLVLDEISECNPNEIGSIVYALANGAGKQRASRSGGSRAAARWRIIALSSGERSLSAHMSEGGKRIKAGQQARLLDVPATLQTYGLFDTLHEHPDGRTFADTMKQATGKHYGLAGPAFIDALIKNERDLPGLYATACTIPEFKGRDGVEVRAASLFALLGLAGELVTEYGITSWEEGDAMTAAINGYELWKGFRGQGQTETRQILQAVSDFILMNGDARFSSISEDIKYVQNRAGYWRDSPDGRIYLFNSPALKEAALGFDIRRILDALDSANWIIEHDKGKRSKKVKKNSASINLYAIRADNIDEF